MQKTKIYSIITHQIKYLNTNKKKMLIQTNFQKNPRKKKSTTFFFSSTALFSHFYSLKYFLIQLFEEKKVHTNSNGTTKKKIKKFKLCTTKKF